MWSLLAFIVALISPSIAIPSSPVFRDTTLDTGPDVAGYLALGLPDLRSSGAFQAGSDGISDSISGTNLNTNQLMVATAPSINAPNTFQAPSGSDSLTVNSAASTTQDTLLSEGTANPNGCPAERSWAVFDKTKAALDAIGKRQDERSATQDAIDRVQDQTKKTLDGWWAELAGWQKALKACQTYLNSGARCHFEDHPRPKYT